MKRTIEFAVPKVACHVCGHWFRPRKDGLPRGHAGPPGSECRSPTAAGQASRDSGRWTSSDGRKRLRQLAMQPVGENGPTVFGCGDMIELLDALEASERRHLRYSNGIDAALCKARGYAENGEPLCSDANAIRALVVGYKCELETVGAYEDVLRESGYDFEEEDDCIDWLRKMLDGCRASKEGAKS